MKNLAEKNIRIANAIFMIGVFLPDSGTANIVFLILWLVSIAMLMMSTKSITLRIMYLLTVVLLILWLFYPAIYHYYSINLKN